MAGGFLQQSRDERVDELMESAPNAFLLVTQIARRARRTDGGFNPHKLDIGEALIGDYRSIGLTEQTYRTAKAQLSTWKIATFRATTKGTVGKLTDGSIYEINADASNGHGNEQSTDGATGQQRTANGRLTTNEECNNGKNAKTKNARGAGAPAGGLVNPKTVKLPISLNTPAFRSAWMDWIAYRTERKLSKPKAISVEAKFRQLEKWGVEAAIEAIESSIANNYQGIFPPKKVNGHAAPRREVPAEGEQF